MRCVPATRKTRFAIAPDFRYLYTRRIQQTVHETILTRRMHASGRRQIFVLRKDLYDTLTGRVWAGDLGF